MTVLTKRPDALERSRWDRWIDYFLDWGVSLAPVWIFLFVFVLIAVGFAIDALR